MRTTLEIDDDVLVAAKGLAVRSGKTIGEVVSELARQALRPRISTSERNGIPLIPGAKSVVTLEIVNALRDEQP